MTFLVLFNKLLNNNLFHIIIYILTSIYIGYTLQPVPVWLNTLFDKSFIFKFFILFFNVSLYLYAKDSNISLNDLIIIIVSCIGILLLFHFFRELDKNKNLEKDEKDLNKKNN